MIKKYDHEQMEKETEEKRQHRLAAGRGYMREYITNQISNETPDEMQSGLEKTRTYQGAHKRKRLKDLTPEQLEKRRRMDRERWKNMTEEQRQRKRELGRLAYIERIRKETPEQRAERIANKATNHRHRMMQMTEAELEERRERRRERYYDSKQKLESSGECAGTPPPEQLEKRRRMDRERWKNMTEEQRQRKREQARVANIKRKMKETPEQRAKRHAIIATCYRRRMMQMTEAEREERLERWRKKRMQAREKRRQRDREYYNGSQQKLESSGECTGIDTLQTGGSQENAETSSTETKRPGRSAKSKAGSNIRHQLEHETPGALLAVSDDSTDALDFRISNNQSDEKIYDSNAATDRTTKSNGKESEDCSMTLAKKWGLRPLVVRLERIDVAELVHKVKQEPAAIDDSAAV